MNMNHQGRSSVAKNVIIGIAIVIHLFVILSAISHIIGLAKENLSPKNVETQHNAVIDNYNAVITAAENACAAQGDIEPQNPNLSPQMVEAITMAYAATYRNAVQGYNNTMDSNFRAGIIHPNGYPTRIENVNTSDWCSVSSQIKSLR